MLRRNSSLRISCDDEYNIYAVVLYTQGESKPLPILWRILDSPIFVKLAKYIIFQGLSQHHKEL